MTDPYQSYQYLPFAYLEDVRIFPHLKICKGEGENRQGAERCSDVVVDASGFPPFKARHNIETKDDGETNQT